MSGTGDPRRREPPRLREDGAHGRARGGEGGVFVPETTPRQAEILKGLLADADHSRHVPDAHLAALSIEYGLTLQTTDRGFARFSGLRWENPIA